MTPPNDKSSQGRIDAWLRFMRELDYNPEKVIEAGSNRPFLLDGQDKTWLILSGKVDVFAVRLRGGEAIGVRRHLFRADTRQILFGMDLQSHRNDIGLLVVGSPGTRLMKIDKMQLVSLSRDKTYLEAIAQLLNSWLEGISEGISHNIRVPRKVELLEASTETELKAEDIARPRKGILWTSSRQGIARFMGWEELPLIGDDDFLPVSERTWIQSLGVNTLATLGTDEFLQRDGLWTCLDNFHRMALDLIAWNMEREKRTDYERLKIREAFDHSVVQNAVSYLTSILRPHRAVTFVPDYGEEPLVTACKMVGHALGIPIRPRPDPVDGQTEPQTLDSIITASHARARRVALRGDWWEQDNGPLLGFLEVDKRPVALLPLSPSRYELHDPTAQTAKPLNAEVATQLAPFAYSIYRTFPETPLRAADVLRFGIYGARRDLMTVLLIGIIGGILSIIPPMVIGRIFDAVIPEREIDQLWILAAVLVISALAGALFQIVRGIAVLRIESKLDASVQAALWDRLLKLPAPFFRAYTAGDLSSRALGISYIRQVVSGTMAQTLLSGIFSIFNFILLFFIDRNLALLATLLVLVAVAITMLAGVLQARHQRALTDLQGRISGLVLQIITGISKLRIAGVESRTFAYWAREFGAQRELTFKTRRIANGLAIFTAAYPIVTSLVIFGVAAYTDRTERLSTGEFVTFISAFGQFLFIGLQLSAAFVALLRLVPVYDRVRPILQTIPEVTETKADPGELTGNIEISRVFFRYADKGPLVLDDISLHIRRGEFVALVGPSGSGKSTLLRLLLGFETASSGGIFYDEQNLSSLDIRAVRRQLGVVLQNSQLISGDIFTNIVGQSLLTMDDAWEAARLAGLDQDISQMPMGMHTFLSGGAGTLSGGQRQRLLIARAIAHHPRILIFDEATSALDNETQAVVSRSLEALEATRIVIAHRLSTIMKADRIVVFERGKIVQEGSYQELIAQENSLFAALAKRQLA